MDLKLGDVQTTALIPVAIRADETKRKNARIRDLKAVEIIEKTGIDTKPYDKFLSHEGVVARTIMMDRQLKGIITKNPKTVVINVAAGFDDRFSRVDNGKILWFDLDLPDSIEGRKKFFEEKNRVTMIAGDALNNSWCSIVKEKIEASCKPVVIAEGLFMYFTFEQIATFLTVLKENFPNGGLLVAEQNPKLMVNNTDKHDVVKNTNAKFMSGSDSAQEIADLVKGFRVVEEHSFHEEAKKYTIRGKIFARLMPKVNNRWATFEW